MRRAGEFPKGESLSGGEAGSAKSWEYMDGLVRQVGGAYREGRLQFKERANYLSFLLKKTKVEHRIEV